MEGKSGLLIVLVILSILFLVAGIFFGVCFGIKNSALVSVELNLVLCVVSLGLFVLSAIGTIVARNSVITADNTYDMLCRIDAILKEKGLTDADLARRDLKQGAKIAKKEAKIKAKLEAKALKEVANENKKAEIEASKKNAVENVIETEETDEATPVSEPEVETETSKTDETSVIPPVTEEPKTVYTFEQWKTALSGKIVCGSCGAFMTVNNTKSGKIVLVCPTNRKDAENCPVKPVSINKFATDYVEFYKQFFNEEELDAFDIDVCDKTLDSAELKDGKFTFKFKTDSAE